MSSRGTSRWELYHGLRACQLHFSTYTVGTDGGDLQIVNIDISFVMSNYCNIAIFIAVELLGILQKVFVV